MRTLVLGLSLVGLGAGGCMLAPTDGERVASTTTALPFTGYDNEANGLVQVSAWDFSAHAVAPVGSAVHAAPSGFNPDGTMELYPWTATRVLGARFWHAGPGGGSCAVTTAQTTHADGNTFNLITVDDDWGDCWSADPRVSAFYSHCQSADSPFAMLFTDDWGPARTSAANLNTIAAVAPAFVRITLNNFTPTANQFCNATNLAQCPTGAASDPNVYRFYSPNSSTISATLPGTTPSTLTFSIPPSRVNVVWAGISWATVTAYLQSMSASRFDFRVDGSQLVLGINFETASDEIVINCMDNALCFALDGQRINFPAPRAELRFTLSASGGKVSYTSASATFTSGPGVTDTNTLQAAAGIQDGLNANLMNPGVRTALQGAINGIVTAAANLAHPGTFPALPVQSVSASSANPSDVIDLGVGCARI